jgi:splicing factor 3B subunit 2
MVSSTKPQSSIKKKRHRKRKTSTAQVPFYALPKISTAQSKEELPEGVEVEYVPEDPKEILEQGFEQYAEIFNKFSAFSAAEPQAEDAPQEPESTATEETKPAEDPQSVSKKQRKKEKRDKIEVLKLFCDRPDLVEVHDVNSNYPWLLVDLKAYRNTVEVPRHWSQRRKYLQGKRGIEKPPFELPEFIRNTGISDMRTAVLEKEESQKLKQKARERVQPKMGKIDIDYQVLYDAFFRYQTKPRLNGHGDLYYEGKEYEVDFKERKPGHLSKQLRIALGMPEEGVQPPPWLPNMQRYGPPPAYPHLKIPGLNAPLPPGAKPGFQTGWGHPPVDENGRPLYGDWTQQSDVPSDLIVPPERNLWGDLEEVESDDEDIEEEPDQMQPETPEPVVAQPTAVPVSNFEAPESLDLRKQKPDKSKALYQELQQKDVSVGNALYGSQHRYVVPGVRTNDRMDIAFDPTELMDVDAGLSEDLIRKKYNDTITQEKAASKKEDVSDIIAAETAKRKNKNKKKDKFRF